MTSTQIKKLNAYPNTYEQVLTYIQSINEDEEAQYPQKFKFKSKSKIQTEV